jgi:hypothetical protein
MPFFCPECLEEYRADDSACPNCGVPLVVFEKLPLHCPKCLTTYPTGMRKCPDCKQDLVRFSSIQEARDGGADQGKKAKNLQCDIGDDFFGDGKFLDD